MRVRCIAWAYAALLAGCYASHERTSDAGPSDALFVAVAAGGHVTCGIHEGDVYCWGSGDSGALGDGRRTEPSLTPRRVPAEGPFVGVDVGDLAACAWREDGAVVCWGDMITSYDPTTERLQSAITAPARVALPPVDHVALGQTHACARVRDGTVWCWGFALNSGQLHGEAERTFWAEPRPMTEGARVWAAASRTCVLRDAGIVCGGARFDDSPPSDAPWEIAGARALSLGNSHACVVGAGGAVSCLGGNDRQQVDASRLRRTELVPAPIADAVELALGLAFSCARRADGSVWCWGWNAYGQLGAPTIDAESGEPVRAEIDGVVELVSGTDHVCARRADGAVWCWGHGGYGELGDGVPREAGSVEAMQVTPVRALLDR